MEKKLESILKPFLETKPACEKKSFIVKSNALVEARYRLSLQESQVVLWLLMQIRPDDEDFKSHRLDVLEFARLVGVEPGNRYSELRRITKQLMQRVMEIHSFAENKIIQVAWLSSTEYEYKKGYVLLEFSPKLKPYLLQLKSHFTKIDIVDTLKLKSIYAVRVFELLLQYNFIGTRQINLDDLRAYCGIDQNEYHFYADFKRKVLEKAKTEINGKTEYLIDYEEIKHSRKVVAIKWLIEKKDREDEKHLRKLSALQKELRSEAILIETMMEYGIGKIIARRLIKAHSEEVVKNAVRAVHLQVERRHAKNPKAMLLTAIAEKWHPEVFKKRQRAT